MSAATRRFWLAVAALVAAAGLWSLNGPLIKLLTPHDGAAGLTGLSIACYRSLIGGIVFLPLARRLSTLQNAGVGWRVASVFTFTLMTICFVTATTMTAASSAIILQYTSPLYVFLLSPLVLGSGPRWSEAAVLLPVMAGVGVIFFGQGRTETNALLIALGSGLGYGSLTVVLRGLRRVSPFVVVTLNSLGSGLTLLVAVFLWDSPALTGYQLALLLLMSVVQFTGPYLLFSWALQHVAAHQAALIVLLETILNPLWTWLLIGERPPVPTLVGGPLILAGVVSWMLLTWRHTRGGEAMPRGVEATHSEAN